MSVQKMFSVYDLKAQAFLQPFFSVHAGSAIRAFEDAVGDSASPIGKHPSDYQLFELGYFDDHSGELRGISPMKLLVAGGDLVLRKQGPVQTESEVLTGGN